MLANLDPIIRLGLAQALAEDGIDVVGDEQHEDAAVLTAAQACPDAIVLGGDEQDSVTLGERLRTAAPESTLIFFMSEEDGSHVLDPRTRSARRMRSPITEALLAELSDSRSKTEE